MPEQDSPPDSPSPMAPPMVVISGDEPPFPRLEALPMVRTTSSFERRSRRLPSFEPTIPEVETVALDALSADHGLLSRCNTLPGELHDLSDDLADLSEAGLATEAGSVSSKSAFTGFSRHRKGDIFHNWTLRSVGTNDFLLRSSFHRLLDESNARPDEERLVAYDAADDGEVAAMLAPGFRKRLDARRTLKPGGKTAADQLQVCTPFDESAFNFSKIRNPKERVLQLQLGPGRYDVLSNKFPLFPRHMLLVAGSLVPQQMTYHHLEAVVELLQPTTFCAYFNSWCASASVNHFHCHLIDEFPPVTGFPLVAGPVVGMKATSDGAPLPGFRCFTPQGFPGRCYVYPISALKHIDAVIRHMQADNQPHNLLFTPRHVYIFPKPLVRPARTFELYPETVGGPELIGSFTTYRQEDYEALTPESIDELVRINTSPLPSRLLQRGGAGTSVDDGAVHTEAEERRGSQATAHAGPGIGPHAEPCRRASPRGIPMARSQSLDHDLLGRCAEIAGTHRISARLT